MPITYQIDHAHKLVDTRGHGLVTDQEVFRYQREAWGRPDVLGYNEIVDMTNLRSIANDSINGFRELADLSAKMDPQSLPSKLAIVVSKFPYYDLARMYERYREMHANSTKQVRIFDARADALRWLKTAEKESSPKNRSSGDAGV